jgi:5-formyltetrahydrofolate cyclo-ligase
MTKGHLRAIALARRSHMPPREREARSRALTSRLVRMAELEEAATVMTYVTLKSEVDTLPLIRECLRRGKRVAAPRVIGPHDMEAVAVADPDLDLEPGSWGIREPRAGLEPLDPLVMDIVVVPGCAFDLRGARLGYGGGFWDRYLLRLRPDATVVGACFAEQIFERVPAEPHDVGMDALATEDAIHRFARSGTRSLPHDTAAGDPP